MRLMITTLVFLTTSLAYAQTRIIGKITDEKGESVPGANIFLEGTYDGATSDGEGKFEFNTTEKGAAILLVKFIGFKTFQKNLELRGELISLSIQLKEEVNELNAVMITAGSFTASDESRRTIFKAIDIATTAGATADIAGVLNTLPGTQKVGESGRLFVRGGDGNETKTFIDGMVLLEAYSPAAPNTPSRGRFLPFMFKGTSFSTGGYSAEYGQALSSALALDSKDEDEQNRTDIGLLSVGGDISHTHVWDKGSWAGKVQYTNIRPYFKLINQEIDWKTPPASLEGSGAYRQRIGKNGIAKVFGNFNQSDFSLYRHDIDNDDIKYLYDFANNYSYLNATYKDALSKDWTVRGGISYNYNSNEVFIEHQNVSETEKGLHAKTVFEGSLSDEIELKTGVEVFHHTYRHPLAHNFDETITATFVEADVYASKRFITRAGARAEYNSLNTWSLDPRISLAYKAGEKGQFSLAYGKFRQSVRNEWLRQNINLSPEKAEHFILNYQLIENNRTFRIETYYKRYDNLVKFDDAEGSMLTNKGYGYARGFEVFWRDNRSIKNSDYWISYSFLDTERDYLYFPHKATPSFASAHNFSIVYKYFVSAWKTQLGTTYSFASGRPYHDLNDASFNSRTTPAYQDLSFNAAYLAKPNLIIYFSCTNLTGRDNIFGYEFSDTPNEEGHYNSRAIRQPAKRFLFVGIFITLSKEKSMNQLPSL